MASMVVAETDNDAGAGNPSPQQPAAADLVPGTLGWRVSVAIGAHKFFWMPHDPGVAAVIRKTVQPTTYDPWTLFDCSQYLLHRSVPDGGNVVALTQIARAMDRAGFLLPCGPANIPLMADKYVTQGGASPGQVGGDLWLSEIFGAELIIPRYNSVTVQISGTDAAGDPRWGSGLLLDPTHIVTNKHVVAALAPGSPLGITPSTGEDGGEQVTCQLVAHPHPELDVALIEIRAPGGKGYAPLAGMAFRDPAWADDVYLFGYPHVPMLAEMVITVQRGEVVYPASETPAGGGLPGREHSCIRRLRGRGIVVGLSSRTMVGLLA